jgi:hypothetical protein
MVDDGVYEFGKSLSNTTAETLDAQQNHATALVFWQDRKLDVTIVSLSRLLSECLGHHVVRLASTRCGPPEGPSYDQLRESAAAGG